MTVPREAAMHVAEWLRTLGLERYEAAFRENNVTADLLPSLTAEDLKELGVALVGDRRRLLTAIAALQSTPDLAAAVPEAGPVAKPEAERRQVTVMFCDLVGSTEFSSRFDPEDLRELIGRYHARAAETVARFDGFVAKYMGDGVLAYFGYPHAHEDDAEQAVRAGLALIGAVGELQGPQRLQVRIGIATGLVVVGDLIGAGLAQEQAIVGETPNLAARLQALAEPGAVVISESTRRQIGGLFEVGDLGSQSLKGFAEPQRAWRVISENRALGRFEALRSGATPLIGRDEEIDLLLRRWSQAKAGRGRVVLISGEPGVGKSRLAEVLVERVAGEPQIRLRYFCSPHHQDSALYPIIAQLERAAGFAREDSPAAKLTKLQAVLGTTAPPSEDVALIAELLSLPATDFAPLDISPQRKKEKTFEALLRQVEGLSRRQPVLMVFEDIHWIDPSSRELLERTIERIVNWPVLLVATFRAEFQAPWIGQPHVAMLALTRLDRRDTATMVANIAGNEGLRADIVQEIAERADGVPLFVEELTNAVLESGPQAALSSAPHPALSVPPSLHASLMARLDRLGPTAKHVAQTGAAIGREFGYELLASTADLSEPQLRRALDLLTHSGLLFARGMPPQSAYIFKHALVQDAAYGTLLRSRRQQLHGRIAATLEGQFEETADTQPEVLARHCTEAGLTEKGVAYWLRAGQQAIARCAMTEAVVQLRKGLDLLSCAPDGAARQQQELDLQITLGHALMVAKGLAAPEPGEAFDRAHQLCDELNLPTQSGSVLIGQFMFRLVRGELEQAEHHGEEIRHLGESRNEVMWKCLGSFLSGGASLFLGKFIDARVFLENGLPWWNPAYRAFASAPDDPYVLALLQFGRTLMCLGYLDQARFRRDEALAEARRLSPYNLVFALCHAWYGDWASEGVESAPIILQSAEKVLAISAEQGFPIWSAVGNVMRGWCQGAEGQAAKSIPLILKGIADLSATGCNVLIPFFLMVLAQVYGTAGQPEEGLKRLDEAAKLVETTRECWAEAEMYRVRGTLLLSTNQHTQAENCYRQALALAQRQGAKFWELRATLDLARLWRDQDKIADAQALLAPIYAWFTEGFDTPDLKYAKALLDELAASSP